MEESRDAQWRGRGVQDGWAEGVKEGGVQGCRGIGWRDGGGRMGRCSSSGWKGWRGTGLADAGVQNGGMKVCRMKGCRMEGCTGAGCRGTGWKGVQVQDEGLEVCRMEGCTGAGRRAAGVQDGRVYRCRMKG